MPGLATKLIGNSTWNGLAFLVGVGLNLVILPFVIDHLGISEFGFAGLIGACLAPAMIFSSVLAQTSARELTQHLMFDSQDRARQVFGSAFSLALLGGIPITLLVILVGPWLARQFFNLDVDDVDHVALGFFWGGIGWFFQCLAGVFLALFTSRQDYPRLAKVSIATTVVATLLMWLLVPVWPRAATYLACQAAGFIVSFGLGCWLGHRNLNGWVSLPIMHLESLRRFSSVGAWQIAAQLCGTISGQIDRYLLGAFLQTRYVGFYNVAQRLEEAIYIGVLKVGEILFPFFSTLVQESEEIQADVLFRTSWLLNLLAVSVLGPLVPLAGQVLQIWTGADVAAEAERVLIVLTLAGILGSGANAFSFYLLGTGRTRSTATISLLTGLTVMGTSLLVLPHLGWRAAGWSALTGMCVQILVIALSMKLSLNVHDLVARIFHSVLAPLVGGGLIAVFLRFVISDDVTVVWWEVLGYYCLCVVMIGGSILAVASIGPYRQSCWHDLNRIARHFMPANRS